MPSFWCQNIFKNVRVFSVALDTSDSVSGASFSSGWNLFCISVCATMIRESVVPIFSPFKLAARFLGCRVAAEESGLAVSGAVISTLKKCDVARNLWTSCRGEFPRAVSCFLKLKSLQLFSYIILREADQQVAAKKKTDRCKQCWKLFISLSLFQGHLLSLVCHGPPAQLQSQS